MTYTILTARYANAELTAITLETVEAAGVSISQADTPELWADLLASEIEIAAYVPPPVEG